MAAASDSDPAMAAASDSDPAMADVPDSDPAVVDVSDSVSASPAGRYPGPRTDTRGIVDAAGLFARVRFRRVAPGAAALRRYVEQYWLIDWDLSEPYASHIVPHPSVNVVFQRFTGREPFAEVAGVGLDLFTQKLEGRGRVCGVKFRPVAMDVYWGVVSR